MPDQIEGLITSVEKIENSLTAFQEKSSAEIKANGDASLETKNAIDKLGEQQKEVADRLLAVEQSGGAGDRGGDSTLNNMGKQFTNSTAYQAFAAGNSQKARFEVQNNTIGTDDAHIQADRKSLIQGSFLPMTLEDFLPSLPTTSNAVEYTREKLFTNNAAEVAEKGAKPESALEFELISTPVTTVAHWVRITRQLANDNAALAAYINLRMAYGVDRKVETQLASGTGVAPELNGLLAAGNSTVHAYAAADVGTVLPRLVLIRKLIADLWALGYPADAILINPADWAAIEIDLLTTAAGQIRVNVTSEGVSTLWGVPVIQAIGMTAGQIQVGAYGQAATVHNREGTVVELSESDADNFTNNLITVRAERRLALTVDRPAAILGGALEP